MGGRDPKEAKRRWAQLGMVSRGGDLAHLGSLARHKCQVQPEPCWGAGEQLAWRQGGRQGGQQGHSPVVAAQGEGALWGGGSAGLEVVDTPLVNDDKAQGPCGQWGEGGGELGAPLGIPHSGDPSQGPRATAPGFEPY